MSEKKYKINIDRPQPSKEEIATRQDFAKLLAAMPTPPKPIYKNPYFWLGTGGGAACLLLAFLFFSRSPATQQEAAKPKTIVSQPIGQPKPMEEKRTMVEKDSTRPKRLLLTESQINTEGTVYAPVISTNPLDDRESVNSISILAFSKATVRPKPYINPPFPKITITYSEYSVDAASGKTINCPTGTRIIIPANAFADANGKPLQGSITLKYREYKDIFECLMSGIPMSYDSAGKKYDFQTAGMFDIQATRGQQTVAIAQGKNIQVEMTPRDASSDFNFYKLDTNGRKWVYQSKDTSRAWPDDVTSIDTMAINPIRGIQDKIFLTTKISRSPMNDLKVEDTADNIDTRDGSSEKDTSGNIQQSKRVYYGNARHVFSISGFGIYNSDHPCGFAHPVTLKIQSFQSTTFEKLQFPETYLIDKTKKILHIYYGLETRENFVYDPTHNNILFGILPGNKIAILREEGFADLPHKDTVIPTNIRMEVPDQEFQTMQAVKDYLYK